jgi:ubiquinone/menaquinone biosynthesis C-methylase UbiE
MKDDPIKAKVQEQFAKNAEKYVSSVTHAKGTDLDAMIEWLQPTQEWTFLDVATGGGHVTKTLSPHVGQVFATDLTPQMLSTARNHLSTTCNNVCYILADAEALPFLDETFDAVACRIAAHHFPNPQVFVAEVSRVLKPGGKFLLIDNVAPLDAELDRFMNITEKLRDESHGRCFTIQEWSHWFNEQGLVITISENRRKSFEFPVWVRRTTKTEEQVDSVVRHILSANQATQAYFSVVVTDGEIQSFQIDEWMVLVEKVQN